MKANALHRVYHQPMVRTELPSAGRVTLLQQTEQHRYVAHLLYAPPLQRGRWLVIEDVPELRDVPVVLKVPEKIRKACLIPRSEAAVPAQDGLGISCDHPRFPIPRCRRVRVLRPPRCPPSTAHIRPELKVKP